MAQRAPPLKKGRGFLFAFLRYERLARPTLVQRVARRVIGSDVIHVAVLPVPRRRLPQPDDAGLLLRTGPHAYTAFMGLGFDRQPAAEVLGDGAFDFVFLPVPRSADYKRGLAFLHGLDGAGYNYLSLFLALMPRAFKTSHPHLPNWLTDEHPFFDSILASSSSRPPTQEGDARIFCSQLGLLLCYACNALPHHTMDPASCLPGELLELLVRDAGAVPYPSTQAFVVDADALPEA